MTTTSCEKTVEETYMKKTPIEHVLLRPDTYVGSNVADEDSRATHWVYDFDAGRVVRSAPGAVPVVPALYKIFDEVLVNAADNKQRDPMGTSLIDVHIDAERGSVRVWNNGASIPIAIHKEHGVYVPELIFGHMLTGSNFDDSQQRTTGGRNGYGAKLAAVFSSRFVIDIVSTADGGANGELLYYHQEFSHNLSTIGLPTVVGLGKDGSVSDAVPEGLREHLRSLLAIRGCGSAQEKETVTEAADPVPAAKRATKKSQTASASASAPGFRFSRSLRGETFTCVTFFPDASRFRFAAAPAPGPGGIEVHAPLFARRAIDLAGTYMVPQGVVATGKKRPRSDKNAAPGPVPLTVRVNGRAFCFSSFREYIALYDGLPPPVFLERVNDRWEVGVALNPDGISGGGGAEMQHLSFVNNIHTAQGGTHVTYITRQLTSYVAGLVERKKLPGGAGIKTHHIRGYLTIYVNALIVNPAFSTQSKECLTTKEAHFGSECVLSEKLLADTLGRSALLTMLASRAMAMELRDLGKALSAQNRSSKTIYVEKLHDAHFAGTAARGRKCMLFLTEGNSANSMALSGFSVIGSEYFGAFPLRGKLLNVRDATAKQIENNAEIQNIIKILGLRFGETYTEANLGKLRYGSVCIMTDQDLDGFHIKGLLINFFACFWPSLLQIRGFLREFVTPLLKVQVRGGIDRKSMSFFSQADYLAWRAKAGLTDAQISVKYYKGLGTSTAQEAKEYFSNFRLHDVVFECPPDATADLHEKIDMIFRAKRTNDRKVWLAKMGPVAAAAAAEAAEAAAAAEAAEAAEAAAAAEAAEAAERENGGDDVGRKPYLSFLDDELIHFSWYDNQRSIANVMDGLKPSQRKILYAMFLRGGKAESTEIKVDQFASFVSENTSYHHGETSLTGAITKMAQNFVGSNNLNLLVPAGQFGTRLMLGEDAASSRYIFTRLHPVTRALFSAEDDALLVHKYDEGKMIEPEFFLPVIPTVLVNGTEGIGTGWSTSVPLFNPRDVVGMVRNELLLLKDNGGGGEPNLTPVLPWYRGFKGRIVPAEDGKGTSFLSLGVIEADPEGEDNVFYVREVPVGMSFNEYKSILENTLTIGHGNGNAKPSRGGGSGGGGGDDDQRSVSAASVSAADMRAAAVAPFVVQSKSDLSDTSATFRIVVDHSALFSSLTDSSPTSLEMLRRFKLVTRISTNNMHLFDAHHRIHRFPDARALVRYFCDQRLPLYEKRKAHMLRALTTEIGRLRVRAHFVELVLSKELVVLGRNEEDVVRDLGRLLGGEEDEAGEENADRAEMYRQLLSMPIRSWTTRNIEQMKARVDERERVLAALQEKTPEDLWHDDLDTLEKALDAFDAEYAANMATSRATQKDAAAPRRAGKGTGGGAGGKRKQTAK